jgi:hypothetical protein
MTAAQSQDGIVIQKAAKPDVPKRVKIILDNGDQIPSNGLQIGHNGVHYLLRPGVVAEVPEHILAVLDDAVADYPVVDPDTQQVVGYQSRSRYPYRRVNE